MTGLITFMMAISLPGLLSLETTFKSDIIQMVIHAGPVVKFILFVLFLFSLVSWTIIFVKWRLFLKARQESAFFLDLFWEGTEFAKLYRECDDLLFSPVAHLFRSGYSEIIRVKKIQSTPHSNDINMTRQHLMDTVERSLRKTSIDQTNRFEKAISFLATTGNTAPFIGLFGTVWGLMESFRAIGLRGSANLAVVAPGISEALIATAAGLAAAIPAVVAYNHFNQKAMTIRSEMDTFSSEFLSLVERQFFKKQMASKEG
ncbi:MAG: protein TolQ [Pseudomonadota bacterium]